MSSTSVTVENFHRAETDTYFAKFVKMGGFGNFNHQRRLTFSYNPQNVVRMNQDTLYSAAVFDLDASSVTLTLPDPCGRFQSMMPDNQDHETFPCVYGPGEFTFTRKQMRTRYMAVLVRTFTVPGSAVDNRAANALQDAVMIRQEHIGEFCVPEWDQSQLQKLRDALIVLSKNSRTLRSLSFGQRKDVDKLGHLMATAAAWGGNVVCDASYIVGSPLNNDGCMPHSLTVQDVPIGPGGFWSITIYNSSGFMEPTPTGINSVNSQTAEPNMDGSYTIHFGKVEGGHSPNCLPITKGWTYTIRLYSPLEPIINGTWTFPLPSPSTTSSRL